MHKIYKTIWRTIAIALAVTMLFSSVACGGNENNTTQNTGNSEQKEQEENVIVNTYEKKTVRLNNRTGGIKILGERNLESSAFINADWSCSGIEFYADCEGTLTLSVTSESPCYFRVYVDSNPYMNGDTPYFTVQQNTIIRVENIERGTHLFRFVKATGYTLARSSIRSVTLCGLICEKAPEEKELYIEYIGDSICCGWGVLPNEAGQYNGSYQCQDGTLAYPYLISSALDADYSITALSGQGLLCGDPGIPLGYKYACYAKNSTDEYTFDRKADVVVVNVGTNDYYQKTNLNINDKAFMEAYMELLTYIREKNGADCKIIAVYNVMNDTFANSVRRSVTQLGGEANGFYLYRADRTSGERGNSHPSINENVKYAENIGSFIKEVLK